MAQVSHETFAGGRTDWETPVDLFRALNSEFHFTLDAAALPQNAKCPRYLSPADDGLARSWQGEMVWLNPPFGIGLKRWARKCWTSWRYDRATVVALFPSRPGRRWWAAYMADAETRHVVGRLRFVGAPRECMFDCSIVIWGGLIGRVTWIDTTGARVDPALLRNGGR